MKKAHFIKYILLLILILAISSWLILMANGYKINSQNYKLEKTGMIYLESTPNEAQVYVNGKLNSEKTPYKLKDIFPGRYDIRITLDGYQEWRETLWVEPEQVSERKYIVLFYDKPQEIKLSDDQKETYNKKLASPNENLSKNLFIRDNNEIWFGDVLVTRLSEDIKKAVWYDDKKHILYQAGKKINIIDVNGTNIFLLAELSVDGASDFISEDKGQTLVYKDGKDLHKTKITRSNGVIDGLTPNILK